MELISLLRIIRTDRIGPVTLKYLLKKHRTIDSVLDYLLKTDLKVPEKQKITEEIQTTTEFGAEFVTIFDQNYPRFLKNTVDGCPVLIVKGNRELLREQLVTVVGTRNPSATGIKFCQNLCKDLVNEKLVVVSGLARGIDTAAHEAAIEKTIAVVAGGIDNVYPPENLILWKKITEKGLVITGQPFGTKPIQWLFPRRNNIMASISYATVVIESTLNSGACGTARKALKEKRKVFAVPGHPFDERYEGNNNLLKTGAKPLTSIKDLFGSAFSEEEEEELFVIPDDDTISKVWNLLSFAPISVETISSLAGLSIQEVTCSVIELSLAGKVFLNEELKATKIV